ncbi:MAG TPA: hypothetical protein VF065_06935, partial [Ilumatobacter sp.]
MTTAPAIGYRPATADEALRRRLPWIVLVAGVVVLQLAFASTEFPAKLDTFIEEPIDDAGAWMRSHRLTHPMFTGFFTPVSDLVDAIISGITDLLLWLPWYVVVALGALLPALGRRWLDTVVVIGALCYCGLFGFWPESMETLALMSAAVLIAVVVGIPLGIWCAVSARVERVARPLLDAMQTVPAFVYFLPLLLL